jgi:hypothetical protein
MTIHWLLGVVDIAGGFGRRLMWLISRYAHSADI